MPWRITTEEGHTFTSDDMTLDIDEQDIVDGAGRIERSTTTPMVRIGYPGYERVILPTAELTLEWIWEDR